MVRPVRAKVEVVEQCPPPMTKELMHFLGMVGYYLRCCKNVSSVVAPLTDSLKAQMKYIWSDRCQAAFENVKTCVLLSARCPSFE
jgi:hypothetical protein